jgi:ABC-type microcin C transport system permease subunit YejB
MTGFQIVVLWSDVLIWLLVVAGIGVGVLILTDISYTLVDPRIRFE